MANIKPAEGYSEDIEEFTSQTSDYYENFNRPHRCLLGNTRYLKGRLDATGLCVDSEGHLCMEIEEE